jgi:TATA-box binding protein (TBP) (component of TFIID and TFIIIB)
MVSSLVAEDIEREGKRMSQHQLIVQNVVCNAYMGAKVDLYDVCEVLHGRYDPSVFPAVVSICRVSKKRWTTQKKFASGGRGRGGDANFFHGSMSMDQKSLRQGWTGVTQTF